MQLYLAALARWAVSRPAGPQLLGLVQLVRLYGLVISVEEALQFLDLLQICLHLLLRLKVLIQQVSYLFGRRLVDGRCRRWPELLLELFVFWVRLYVSEIVVIGVPVAVLERNEAAAAGDGVVQWRGRLRVTDPLNLLFTNGQVVRRLLALDL